MQTTIFRSRRIWNNITKINIYLENKKVLEFSFIRGCCLVLLNQFYKANSFRSYTGMHIWFFLFSCILYQHWPCSPLVTRLSTWRPGNGPRCNIFIQSIRIQNPGFKIMNPTSKVLMDLRSTNYEWVSHVHSRIHMQYWWYKNRGKWREENTFLLTTTIISLYICFIYLMHVYTFEALFIFSYTLSVKTL